MKVEGVIKECISQGKYNEVNIGFMGMAEYDEKIEIFQGELKAQAEKVEGIKEGEQFYEEI